MTCPCHPDIIMSRSHEDTLWSTVDASPHALLAGVRVVDMADEKGETCGRFLADLGADVIRVEPPGGAARAAAAVPRRRRASPSPSATRTSAASPSTSRRRPTASACWRCSSPRTLDRDDAARHAGGARARP